MQPAPDPNAASRRPAVTGLVLIFAAGACAEFARVVSDTPWRGFGTVHSHVVSSVLTVLWTTAAITVANRRRSPALAQAAWLFGIVGTVAMLPHTLVPRLVGGSPWSLLFLPAGVFAAWLLTKVFGRGEYARLRRAVVTERGGERVAAPKRRATETAPPSR